MCISNVYPYLELKIGDFGMAKENSINITDLPGEGSRPPEFLANRDEPYDGEKADIFAASFILIAIYTLVKFSNGEQAESLFYMHFKRTGNLEKFWA